MIIYWASIEFNLKPKNKDFGKFKGGFVYLFVKANDKITALKKIKTELDKANLKPINIEFIKPYKNVEWENEKEEKHFEIIIEETNDSSEVIFDDFYMYKKTE